MKVTVEHRSKRPVGHIDIHGNVVLYGDATLDVIIFNDGRVNTLYKPLDWGDISTVISPGDKLTMEF